MATPASVPAGPGSDRTHWVKVRARHTAEPVVGAVIGPLTAPEALLLGRIDQRGQLRVVGRTGPLTLPARRELGTLLQEPVGEHPWPAVLPASRFGRWASGAVSYVQVKPSLVVEIDADTSFEHGRWLHPTRMRRVRLDLRPDAISHLSGPEE